METPPTPEITVLFISADTILWVNVFKACRGGYTLDENNPMQVPISTVEKVPAPDMKMTGASRVVYIFCKYHTND